jgi:3-dehydroquinate dehydratase-1
MGDYGKMSRILCLYLGSPFTYVSLGKPVAPGQFSLDQIKKIVYARKK